MAGSQADIGVPIPVELVRPAHEVRKRFVHCAGRHCRQVTIKDTAREPSLGWSAIKTPGNHYLRVQLASEEPRPCRYWLAPGIQHSYPHALPSR